MKKSLIFHMCGLLYGLLLLSPRATCLSLQKLEKRDIPDEYNSQLYPSLLPPTNSTVVQDVNKSVSLPNVKLTVVDESLNNSRVLITHTVDPNSEDSHLGLKNEAAPNGNNISVEYGIRATDTTTTVTFFSKPTQEDPYEPHQTLDNNSLNLNPASLENVLQLNTMEMLTTNPRTSIYQAEDSENTTSSHLIGEPAVPGNVLISESPMGSETPTLVNENIVPAVPQFSEDWDDTKVPTVGPNTVRSSDAVTPGTNQLGNETREAAVFTILPGVTVPSDDKSVFSAVANLPEEKGSFDINESRVNGTMSPLTSLSNNNSSTPLPSMAAVDVQSQDFPAVYTGAKQPDSDSSNGTMTPATFTDVTSQDTSTMEAQVIDKAGETIMDSAPPPVDIPADESINGTPSTPQVLPVDMPITEDVKGEDEYRLVGSLLPDVLPEATTGTSSASTVMITSAPQVDVIVPPMGQITSPTPYGSEKLESEEGDDEDEEDEDEDDDEGDEDDEDEDDEKENKSVDDSAEKDSDLPLFTLPGLSSQEPLEDDSNIALIDGAAYQVPDTREWEQQNQGLVRSWMEKLKDKAGYMSGMLVPVGVGIVGALLILGALYSIKIMNRRRRNGFKRHKRKQREFNSMQDRVMLLADSSEDEF